MSGYTKVFGSILDSTIWLESSDTKVVWITMLVMADRDGIVMAAVPGLARRAGVCVDAVRTALAKFMAADPDSSSPEFDGRRIEAVDGGWRILNYAKYMHRMSAEDIRQKAVIRQQKKRDRDRNAASRPVTPDVTPVTPSHGSHDTRQDNTIQDKINTPPLPPSEDKPDDNQNPNTPPTTPNPDFDGHEWALKTCKAYPTWKDQDALNVSPEIGRLYQQTIEREAPARGGELAAAEWLLARVRQFAKSKAETDPKFIPSLENFLSKQLYAQVEMPAVSKVIQSLDMSEEAQARRRDQATAKRAERAERRRRRLGL